MSFFGRQVDPDVQQVVKFLPSSPPYRGDVVVVDGVRCRVTWSRIKWRDSGVWEIRSLRVKEEL